VAGGSLVGRQACRPAGQVVVAWEAFHCLGVQMPKFQLSLVFTTAKCVSSVSASSLIPRAHAVCDCVPVAILDPQSMTFLYTCNK
jgi:hypothetical protein